MALSVQIEKRLGSFQLKAAVTAEPREILALLGPSGCGSTAKVANNMMVGIHLCAMGEAFAFAKKAGLDPQTLFDAIKGGFAQSAVMDGKVPKLLSRDFSASARIAVHLKDINNAMDVAAHLGVCLLYTSDAADE